jgi:hypothetical protein
VPRSGLVTVRLVNEGREPHYARLLRADSGRTLNDFNAWRESRQGLPAWLTPVGGPAPVMPGDSTDVTLDLRPGRYIALCSYPTPAGVPHIAKGMVAEFQIGNDSGTVTAAPAADDTVDVYEYTFRVAGNIVSGRRTFLAVNRGAETHQVLLIRLAPGRSVEDEIAWFRGGSLGPRPNMPYGGLLELPPGSRAWFAVALRRGDYLLLCGVPDKNGTRHFEHGMTRRLAVR